MQSTPPRVIIIAGPNGAGKTTFAEEFLPAEAACPHFVNADLIAAGLSPFRPEERKIAAGRLMLKMMDDYALRGESFAFETTLSGTSYVKRLRKWKEQGYVIWLIYLTLDNEETAIARVANRVKEGGHNIPEADIRRRFSRSLINLWQHYMPIKDRAFIFDATDLPPTLINKYGEE